jgi:kumamolisin
LPASSRWVLAVGGTTLRAAHEQIISETAWRATGGGVSKIFDLPAWQRDLTGLPGGDRQSARAIPDVAAAAAPENGYRIVLDGATTVVGGTGAAAALWAGLVARLNEKRGKNLGYLNPVLYQEIGPRGVLRDVTRGNNGIDHVTGYRAAVGWDAVSGWGSPDGGKLLDWLQRQRP